MADAAHKRPVLTRRRLLIGAGAVAGGGLVLAWFGEDADEIRIADDASTLEPNAWLQVSPDGRIVLQVDKLEMGQGVMTGFVTLVAEELGVAPEAITARHAPVHALFQDPSQMTGDSKSMRSRWRKLSRVGATAREMLAQAAAERWGVTRDAVDVPGDGTLVSRDSGAVLAYAEVAAVAARRDVPRDVPLKSPAQYRTIGRDVARTDAAGKVTGATQYGIDMDVPGQLTAVVVRAPVPGGRLTAYDDAAARGAPGVRGVYRIGAGLAVVADNYWRARQVAQRLDVEWSGGASTELTTAAVHERQRAIIESGELLESRHDGDVDAALAAAERVVEVEYALPFAAHATMEPMNATVRVGMERCDVWAAVQSPDVTRQLVADLTGLAREQVHVHVLPCGGAFGRRFMNDFVVEATEIALRANAPIRLLWSREDDMRHDYFHAATLHRMRAALDASGQPVAWEHRLVAPDLSRYIMPDALATLLPERTPDAVHGKLADWLVAAFAKFLGPVQAWNSAKTLPYEFANLRVALRGFDPGVRVGIWRAVGHHFNAFAVESFVDELAHAAGEDPLEFRVRRLAGRPRHVAVLRRLARESGWGRPGAGRHHGVALLDGYDSVVGQVAEVSVDGDELRVHRVTCVVDCGLAINPDVVRQQMEGGIIFGMTAALHGEIEFEDGRVRQSNFHDYRMLRMADSPAIDVHIVASDADPGGIGEAGVPPIAPALANAVFAATGRRIRRLPLRL
jgi:isoquinoline 1-oxidoreductase/isoquinoline 1-oxidoreductase beta subunit